VKTAQHLLATLAAVIACLLPFTAQAEATKKHAREQSRGMLLLKTSLELGVSSPLDYALKNTDHICK
jgi:hypothetical protein